MRLRVCVTAEGQPLGTWAIDLGGWIKSFAVRHGAGQSPLVEIDLGAYDAPPPGVSHNGKAVKRIEFADGSSLELA